MTDNIRKYLEAVANYKKSDNIDDYDNYCKWLEISELIWMDLTGAERLEITGETE